MKLLRAEATQNFNAFTPRWREELEESSKALGKYETVFQQSYERLISLEAWGSRVLEHRLSDDAMGFYREAQNDALVSHVMARLGAWRLALKSLRSCIENVLYTLYYMDHQIELELWTLGRYKVGFAAVHKYLIAHPLLYKLPRSVTGLDLLHGEYGTLSRAVHAAAKGFRMTSEGDTTQLWNADIKQLRAWAKREKQSVVAVNLLLLSLFRTGLSGAQQLNLREAISLVVSNSSKRALVKTSLGITLYS